MMETVQRWQVHARWQARSSCIRMRIVRARWWAQVDRCSFTIVVTITPMSRKIMATGRIRMIIQSDRWVSLALACNQQKKDLSHIFSIWIFFFLLFLLFSVYFCCFCKCCERAAHERLWDSKFLPHLDMQFSVIRQKKHFRWLTHCVPFLVSYKTFLLFSANFISPSISGSTVCMIPKSLRLLSPHFAQHDSGEKEWIHILWMEKDAEHLDKIREHLNVWFSVILFH